MIPPSPHTVRKSFSGWSGSVRSAGHLKLLRRAFQRADEAARWRRKKQPDLPALAGPVSRWQEAPRFSHRSRALGQDVELAEEPIGAPGQPVLHPIRFPADNVNLASRPIEHRLQFAKLFGGRCDDERPLDRLNDHPPDRLRPRVVPNVVRSAAPMQKQVSRTQALISVPADWVSRSHMGARRKPISVGLLAAAKLAVLLGHAEVDGPLGFKEIYRRHEDVGVAPLELQLGLQVGPRRVEADRLRKLDARPQGVESMGYRARGVANTPSLTSESHLRSVEQRSLPDASS